MRVETVVQHIPPAIKPAMDVAAIMAWISVLAGHLTTIVGLFAALVSLAWGCIRLYETRTVQKWFGRKSFSTRRNDGS